VPGWRIRQVGGTVSARVHTHNPTGSVLSGFTAGARVVTAAAIIMIFVFGSFIFGGQPAIKSIGLALAFGVLADAFLVRMTLVPAVLVVMSRKLRSLRIRPTLAMMPSTRPISSTASAIARTTRSSSLTSTS